MLKIPNFKFKISLSIDCYQSKTDAIACLSSKGAKAINKETMAFVRREVTVPEFLSYMTQGYTCCNLFDFDPNKEYWFESTTGYYKTNPVYKNGNHKGAMKMCMKADRFFAGAQTIFVDVDYTKYSDVKEYLSKLHIKPTCVYMSYSDKMDKGGVTSRRFRMVYVFDRILNKKEFLHISQLITDLIVFDTAEPMEDDCGKRISQYMNGVYGNDESYISDIIYSVFDFPEEVPEQIPTAPNVIGDQRYIAEQIIAFDERLLYEMENKSYSEFMHFHSTSFEYRYRTEGNTWIDNLYQITEQNYLQLWWYREKQIDGQHRRRKLFKNACLRRLMFPEMDPNTALFNLYVDRERFFDNSDGELTLKMLCRKVKHAFEKTKEQLIAYCHHEIKYWEENRPQFIIRPGITINWGLINNIKCRIRYAEIDKMYNFNLSVQENIAAGIDVPQTTLYRYCQMRGYNTNPNKPMTEEERRKANRQTKLQEIESFKSLYCPTKSLRENRDILLQHGIDISFSTVKNWAERYCESQPENTMYDNFPLRVKLPEFDLGFAEKNSEPAPQNTMFDNFSLGVKIRDFDLTFPEMPKLSDAELKEPMEELHKYLRDNPISY